MIWDDEKYGEDDPSLGRAVVPLEIPLDRSVVTQAQAHLREQSPERRARWHRQIEVVLHRFARSQGHRRRAVNVGGGRTQVWWMPPKGPGLPLTDIQVLRDPALHASARFQALCCEISDQSGLAQLVIASLLVRRDYRFRDFASIRAAKAVFEAAAPALARIAHRYSRDPEAFKSHQTLHLRNISHAGTQALEAKTAAKHQPILEYLEALVSKKTPRSHWAQLTAKAMRRQGLFLNQKKPALIKMIQRDMKDHFPPDKQ